MSEVRRKERQETALLIQRRGKREQDLSLVSDGHVSDRLVLARLTKNTEGNMLGTRLKHLETEQEVQEALANNENVMVCCGRMGPMCIPVYGIMEQLETRYKHVAFRDQDFDGPAARFIKRLPECSGFRGLPFTVYFKKGKVVAATTSIQHRKQVTEILDKQFGKPS